MKYESNFYPRHHLSFHFQFILSALLACAPTSKIKLVAVLTCTSFPFCNLVYFKNYDLSICSSTRYWFYYFVSLRFILAQIYFCKTVSICFSNKSKSIVILSCNFSNGSEIKGKKIQLQSLCKN